MGHQHFENKQWPCARSSVYCRITKRRRCFGRAMGAKHHFVLSGSGKSAYAHWFLGKKQPQSSPLWSFDALAGLCAPRKPASNPVCATSTCCLFKSGVADACINRHPRHVDNAQSPRRVFCAFVKPASFSLSTANATITAYAGPINGY